MASSSSARTTKARSSAALGEGDDPRQAHALNHRVLVPQLSGVVDGRATLGYRCANSRMTIACAVEHQVEADCDVRVNTEVDDDVAKTVVHARMSAGDSLMVTKFATFHTSRGVPPNELADRCNDTLDRGIGRGAVALAGDQRRWLDDFWDRSDVELPGRPRIQQAVRWNLFQLAQATGRVDQHVVTDRIPFRVQALQDPQRASVPMTGHGAGRFDGVGKIERGVPGHGHSVVGARSVLRPVSCDRRVMDFVRAGGCPRRRADPVRGRKPPHALRAKLLRKYRALRASRNRCPGTEESSFEPIFQSNR